MDQPRSIIKQNLFNAINLYNIFNLLKIYNIFKFYKHNYMTDLIFNNDTDRYIFTGSRLRAPPTTTLHLSTADNEAYIELSSNSILDISAATMNINTYNLSIIGGRLNVGNNIVTSNNNAKIFNTVSTYKIVQGEQLLSHIGTISRDWRDASGWTISINKSSIYSYVKIEARIAYTSSPEVDQTLSFRMLRYSQSTDSYSIETFSDLSLGSNMGVTLHNVHTILFYDICYNNVADASYQLQYMRNCPTNNTISNPFGIRASSGNFMSLQEIYRPSAS